jgi:hypothetical protein
MSYIMHESVSCLKETIQTCISWERQASGLPHFFSKIRRLTYGDDVEEHHRRFLKDRRISDIAQGSRMQARTFEHSADQISEEIRFSFVPAEHSPDNILKTFTV